MRYVVFDRDGTLIVDKRSMADPAEVELVPGARDALARVHQLGLGAVIVTYQPSSDLAAAGRVNGRMMALLGNSGKAIRGIYLCPHDPAKACDCRRPKNRLLKQAARELKFKLEECVVIEPARNAEAPAFLVTGGFAAPDLLSAVEWIAASIAR